MIARMEEKSAEQRKGFNGPWNLTFRMTPYTSRRFKLDRAKTILHDEGEKKP